MRQLAVMQARNRLDEILPGFPDSADRQQVWAWLLMTFFRYPQGVLMLLVVGLVAPPLIARDIGSQAFLLYFSRPITRCEYIGGKLAIVWVYVLLITTLPALILYGLGVLLSPSLDVVGYTWDLPPRILAASAVLLLPTTTLALAISSLTTKTWQASFIWFALWTLGFAAYGILLASLGSEVAPRWTVISLYHTLGRVQSWAFGLEPRGPEVMQSAALLAAVTVISLLVVYRRISSPMRI